MSAGGPGERLVLELGAATIALCDARAAGPAACVRWLAAARDHLDPRELERMQAYLVPEKRIEFLLGRVVARWLLGERFGVPREAPIDAPEGAKPALRSRSGGPFFNIAHSDLAIAAIASGDRDVAIDIERVRAVSPGLLEATLVEDELAHFRSHGLDLARFFRIWTAKEAFMKLAGAGLRIAPRRLAVDLERRTVLDRETGERRLFGSARRQDLVCTWMVGEELVRGA